MASLRGDYRAILFDPPGSGGSDDPTGPLSIVDVADEAMGLLEHLSVDRALLVATSMGGFVALEMALRHRAAVEGLVLFARAASLDGLGRFQIESWQRLRREGTSPESLLRLQLAATLPSALFDDSASIEAMIAFFLSHRESLWQSDEGFFAQAQACLAFDREEEIGAIDCPALVVAGGEDRMVPPEKVEALHRRLEGSRFETLPRGGHALAATESPAMARLVEAFAASL